MMNDPGSSEAETETGAQTLPAADTDAGASDPSVTTETPPPSSSIESEPVVHNSTAADPDDSQAIKDLQMSLDSAHLTLIFLIGLIGGITVAQNFIKGWLHA